MTELSTARARELKHEFFPDVLRLTLEIPADVVDES
jgi:hypothetical protein